MVDLATGSAKRKEKQLKTTDHGKNGKENGNNGKVNGKENGKNGKENGKENGKNGKGHQNGDKKQGEDEEKKEEEVVATKFRQHPIYQLSLGQLGFGVTALLTQLALTYFSDPHLDFYTLNEGLLCGAAFTLTGLLGVWACRHPSRRLLATFLTGSGLAAVAAGLLLTFSCAHLAEILWYQETDDYAASSFPLLKTLLSLQIVVSILQLCLALTCVALCAKTCCSSLTSPKPRPLPSLRRDGLAPHRYPTLPVKLFSSLQILLGVSSIFLFGILFLLAFDSRHSLTFEELYCGLVFIGIGVFGFYTVKSVAVTSLTPFMVLNIFGFLFAGLLLCLALVRIYMFDMVQERNLEHRRDDLDFFPTLNCTKDVLEDIVDLAGVDYTRRHTTPSPEDVERSIRNCERLREEGMQEARSVLRLGSELGVRGPRRVFQIEVVLAVFECLATIVCATLSARACCCGGKEEEQGYFPTPPVNDQHEEEGEPPREEGCPSPHRVRTGERRGEYREFRK